MALSGTIQDIGEMAPNINKMSASITELTDNANNLLADVQDILKPVLLPIAIAGGGLLVTYLITGIVANIKQIREK